MDFFGAKKRSEEKSFVRFKQANIGTITFVCLSIFNEEQRIENNRHRFNTKCVRTKWLHTVREVSRILHIVSTFGRRINSTDKMNLALIWAFEHCPSLLLLTFLSIFTVLASPLLGEDNLSALNLFTFFCCSWWFAYLIFSCFGLHFIRIVMCPQHRSYVHCCVNIIMVLYFSRRRNRKWNSIFPFDFHFCTEKRN